MPMLVSLAGACVLRMIWIATVFQVYHTAVSIYWSYPVSWIITLAAHIVCYVWAKRRLDRRVRAGIFLWLPYNFSRHRSSRFPLISNKRLPGFSGRRFVFSGMRTYFLMKVPAFIWSTYARYSFWMSAETRSSLNLPTLRQPFSRVP